MAPDEAFAVLGNELRLAIVRVLWRAGAAREYDDGALRRVATATLGRLADERGSPTDDR